MMKHSGDGTSDSAPGFGGRQGHARRGPFTELGSAAAKEGLSILIVMSKAVSRYGVTAMLGSLPGVSKLTAVSAVAEASQELAKTDPDLVIASAEVNPDDYRPLRQETLQRGARLMIVLRDGSEEQVSRASTMDADGYMLECELTAAALGDAVHRLAAGEMVLGSQLGRSLLADIHAARPGRLSGPLLTCREKQTLQLLVNGLSNKQIAVGLGISVHGAKRHVANLLAKMSCPNRTTAVALALREGLID
jgi:two-component system, NarL family, nitrate/nitrite response regulator NarL